MAPPLGPKTRRRFFPSASTTQTAGRPFASSWLKTILVPSGDHSGSAAVLEPSTMTTRVCPRFASITWRLSPVISRRVPSGAHLGSLAPVSAGNSRRWCVPSAFISHSSSSYPVCRLALTKAICEPSGDHDGWIAPSALAVNCRLAPVVRRSTQIDDSMFGPQRWYAILAPSGDHAAACSCARSRVSCRRPEPSGRIR